MTDLLYPHTVISTQASSAFEELGAAATEMPTMTTTMMMEEEEEDPYARFRFYEDGEEMTQIWNASFVVFAYLLSCVGSYSAVHLLDHGLWRRGLDKTQLENNKIMIRYPELYAACLLGFGSVWCMHFVSTNSVLPV